MHQGLNWQKSSFSGSGDSPNCMELAAVGEGIALRESETPAAVVRTTPAVLGALIRAAKCGVLDGREPLRRVAVRRRPVR